MNSRLIVIADLGHFKAYRLEEDANLGQPRLELIDDYQTSLPNHLREEVTDQAGRYRKGTVGAGQHYMSDGEQHNVDLERRRRAAKAVAKHLDELTQRENADAYYFAAPSEVNNSILEEMSPQVRSKIEKNVKADLTRVSPEQVIQHFTE
jgi:hypothetical protein